jgi:nitric oxide reductase subunit B
LRYIQLRYISRNTTICCGIHNYFAGALTAHYTVEGQGFYGLPLAGWIPYAVSRTWHVQLGVFWIATAFLAAGLFLAPAVGGREPRY